MIRPDPRFGSGHLQNPARVERVESGRVKRCSKYHGLGRAGPGGFQISRVGQGNPDSNRPAKSPADFVVFCVDDTALVADRVRTETPHGDRALFHKVDSSYREGGLYYTPSQF